MFLPHIPMFFFEVATAAARGGSPGLIERQSVPQMKAKRQRQKFPSLKIHTNVFHLNSFFSYKVVLKQY